MKTKMKAAVVSVALLSCPQFVFAQENVERTEKAGKIGCGVGAVVGGLLGNKLFKDHKAVGTVAGAGGGCAAGNFFGKKFSKAKQLKEFKQAQAQAEAAGLKSTVSERDGVNEQGKPAKELDALRISYKPTDVVPMNPQTEGVITKLADIAHKSTNALTVTISGEPQACGTIVQYMSSFQLQQGSGVTHVIKPNCKNGSDNTIVITPVPELAK